MSGIGMIYDPNDPVSLHRAWEDHCGFGDKHGNGWVFLNDDRVVLDMIATDFDNKWVFGPDPDDTGKSGFDVIIEHARSIDARNVLIMHHHRESDDFGPCDELPNFAQTVTATLDDADIQVRGILICTASRLDGVMYAQKVDKAELMAGTVIEGLRMRKMIADRTDITEHEREIIIAAIDNTLEVLVGVARVDVDLMREATEIAARKAIQNVMQDVPPEQKRDPFALPSINISDIKYMN